MIWSYNWVLMSVREQHSFIHVNVERLYNLFLHRFRIDIAILGNGVGLDASAFKLLRYI